MNVQADREALTSYINSHGYNAAAPTGLAYIAADGTIWHQYTNLDADGDDPMWATTRISIHAVMTSYTYRITNDTMVLEDVF